VSGPPGLASPERTAASDRIGVVYLSARLDVVEARIRRTLAERGDAAPSPDAASVAQRLSAAEAVGDHAEARGEPPRLRALARACALDAADLELLLIALAPEAEPRFGRLYSYLHDDADCRRATVGLALELCGTSPLDGAYRSRLVPGAALPACGLVVVQDTGLPFPDRTLRVPDRVVSHLLGDDRPDPALGGIARMVDAVPRPPVGSEAWSAVEHLAACLPSDAARGRPAYLRGTPDSAVTDVAMAAAATAVGGPGGALVVDLARIPAGTDAGRVLAVAAAETRLRGCGLVVGPVESLPSETAERARILSGLSGLPFPVVLTGDTAWDARWSESLPLLLDIPAPGHRERGTWWRHLLAGLPDEIAGAAQALSLYKLPPDRMRATVAAVAAQASAERRAATIGDLLRTARLHNAADLERVARRVEPSAGWDDLVLADQPTGQLRELADRYRHRGTVLTDWRLRPRHGRGRGVAAMFTGESGTGKTLAAEVLAAVSGVDLYVVNLATVVDKYVGETEKNLERIFTAAADAQGMLFFDEADALFGKRSQVTDAHDRFANIETAYLLQRLENFDGIAVLATNLAGNVDQAFLRRLDAIIHFPRPGETQRTRLWDLCLGTGVPRAADLDLAGAAAAFELNGGTIRSCAITASYRAARTGRPVTTADLFAAVRAEYHKLGRLIDESEFTVSPR
jgi:ATPase family associated with various cellular activities (AAA)